MNESEKHDYCHHNLRTEVSKQHAFIRNIFILYIHIYIIDFSFIFYVIYSLLHFRCWLLNLQCQQEDMPYWIHCPRNDSVIRRLSVASLLLLERYLKIQLTPEYRKANTNIVRIQPMLFPCYLLC